MVLLTSRQDSCVSIVVWVTMHKSAFAPFVRIVKDASRLFSWSYKWLRN